jgi:uncharacterized protein YkwD
MTHNSLDTHTVRSRRIFVAAALAATLLVGYFASAGRAGAATAPVAGPVPTNLTLVVDPGQPATSATPTARARALARAKAIAQAKAVARAKALARAKAIAQAKAAAKAKAVASSKAKQAALDRKEDSIARAVLALLNSERRANGLPALTMSSQLVRSAHGHNITMAKFNTMSHQLPGEPYFTARIDRTGYRWRTAGENVGWNSEKTENGALYLEKLMYNEKAPNDGHRRNILSSSYRNVGIDIVIDSRTGKLWLSQDFGSLR